MPTLRQFDLLLAAGVALATLTYPLSVGDPLFLGAWYYIAVPVVVIGAAVSLEVGPLFVFGTACALTLTYVPYWYFQASSARPEGLLGLAHMFSLPGSLIGLAVADRVLRRLEAKRSFVLFTVGAVATFLGFLLVEFSACAMRVYCGPTAAHLLLSR